VLTSGTKVASGAWMWRATGEPFTYEGWWANEPSRAKIDTVCIYNKRGLRWGWNDVPMYKQFYVLCEFPHPSYV